MRDGASKTRLIPALLALAALVAPAWAQTPATPDGPAELHGTDIGLAQQRAVDAFVVGRDPEHFEHVDHLRP